MTDLMRIIYEYICENRQMDYVPFMRHLRYRRLIETQEDALRATCSEQQKELLDQFQSTQSRIYLEELEAMFLATWDAVRELR